MLLMLRNSVILESKGGGPVNLPWAGGGEVPSVRVKTVQVWLG